MQGMTVAPLPEAAHIAWQEPPDQVVSGQVWTAGRLGIRVLDVHDDGRVWFRTNMHPEQGMTGKGFLAWLRAIRVSVSLPH